MRVILITTQIVLLLILSSIAAPVNSVNSQNLQTSSVSHTMNSSYIPKTNNNELAQVPNYTSKQLVNGVIQLLNARLTDNGSSLITTSKDPVIYYGISGGLAGIGMRLLEALEQNNSMLTPEGKNLASKIVIQIATNLNQSSQQNATHSMWTISNDTQIVDMSWDFGLSGILAFYSRLYNYFGNFSYLQVANRTLNTIFDIAYNGTTTTFQSNTHRYIFKKDWYPTIDFSYYYNISDVVFSGIGLGTAGIAKGALTYLNTTGIEHTKASNLLNGSINYLDGISISNGSELSYETAEQYPGLKSTSYSTGVSGIGQLFLDLYDYTGNNSYLDQAKGTAAWLIGNNTDEVRWTETWEINGTMEQNFVEYGLSHGIAGAARYLLNYAKTVGTTNATIRATRALTYVSTVGVDRDNGYQFGVRNVHGSIREVGSTSYETGGAGIFELLYDASRYLNDSNLKDVSDDAKRYLLTQTIEVSGYPVIKSKATNFAENNPSTGYPPSLSYLTRTIPGKLLVQKTSISFGQVKRTTVAKKNITLYNTGSGSISVNWTITGNVFTTSTTSTIVPADSSKELTISFSTSLENTFEDTITFTQQSNEFSVDLSATSFDLPSLTLNQGVAEGQKITSTDPIKFVVTATDTSEIQSVRLGVNGTSNGMTSISDTNKYEYSWTPPTQNGTYVITITATDSVGYQSSINRNVSIGIYSTPIEERLFSTNTILILSGIVFVMVVAAIFLTRRYMS